MGAGTIVVTDTPLRVVRRTVSRVDKNVSQRCASEGTRDGRASFACAKPLHVAFAHMFDRWSRTLARRLR